MEDRVLRHFRFEFEFLGLGYALIAVLGMFGNFLILKTFWRERRASWFHIQLAVANMISLIATSLSGPSASRGRWLFGKFACQWYGFQTCLSSFAEILFTCAICMETYLIICHKNKYENLTKRTFMIASGSIWAYALLFSLAPLFGWNRYTVERFSVTCGIDLQQRTTSTYYHIVATHGVFILMVLATLAFLVITYRNRHKHDDTQTFDPLFTDMELIKISCALFSVLVVCCFPYYLQVLTVLRSARPIFRSFLSAEFSKLSMKLGCCLQPYVYIVFSGHFKSQCIASITGVTPEKKRN